MPVDGDHALVKVKLKADHWREGPLTHRETSKARLWEAMVNFACLDGSGAVLNNDLRQPVQRAFMPPIIQPLFLSSNEAIAEDIRDFETLSLAARSRLPVRGLRPTGRAAQRADPADRTMACRVDLAISPVADAERVGRPRPRVFQRPPHLWRDLDHCGRRVRLLA